MRKIIAVLVVFALVAGAAFAETTIGGALTVKAVVVDIANTDNTDAQPTSSGGVHEVSVNLSGSNDEGTFGGHMRLKATGSGPTSDGVAWVNHAYIWWKPIEQLEVFLGQDPDGKFAFYNPWSHFNGSEGLSHPNANWRDWRRALAFTNWDTFGLALTLKPIPGLELNLVIPTGEVTNLDTLENDKRELNDIWGGGLQLTASFAIPDIGNVWFGLKGPGYDADQNSSVLPGWDGNIFHDKPLNYGWIGLGFSLSAVDGLELLVGGSTIIPGEQSDQPVYLQLVANYSAGDFGVKSRFFVALNSTTGYSQAAYAADTTYIAADILPYYNLGILTAYLNIGFSTKKVGSTDPVNTFVINPYIRMSLGAGSIRAGVVFNDENLDIDGMKIQVPIVFGFSF